MTVKFLYFHVFIFQCVIDNVPDRSQGEGKQRLSFTADLVRSDLDIGLSPYLALGSYFPYFVSVFVRIFFT